WNAVDLATVLADRGIHLLLRWARCSARRPFDRCERLRTQNRLRRWRRYERAVRRVAREAQDLHNGAAYRFVQGLLVAHQTRLQWLEPSKDRRAADRLLRFQTNGHTRARFDRCRSR